MKEPGKPGSTWLTSSVGIPLQRATFESDTSMELVPTAAMKRPRHASVMASPALNKGRWSEKGAYYVVTVVTASRTPWFREPRPAHCIAGELKRCEDEERLRSLAWVVMPDHVHWLFELGDGSISQCLQAFKSRSARVVNEIVGRAGPVWQAGFYDHRVRSHEDLRSQARYIVRNPLRRGLVERLDHYPHWYCEWPADA